MRPPETRSSHRTLFECPLFEVRHVAVRPASPAPGPIEHATWNVLVLPLAGVFTTHTGPRQQSVATPNHAVLLSAGGAYRFGFPGCIGDDCMTLRLTSAGLDRLFPEAVARGGFDAAAFASRALLTPDVMLARSLLWHRLARGDADPLLVEELGVGLLASSLRAARHARSAARNVPTPNARRAGRYVEFVKEAVSTSPERKWTLGHLAAIAGVSPHHLAHVFRHEVGTSVYRYVLRSRLAGALTDVIDSHAELTTVALDAGFASHSHFTARFKALFGVTPSALRRSATAPQVRGLRQAHTVKAGARKSGR